MGDRYAATGTVVIDAAPDTLLALNGFATTRGRIYDFGFGCLGSPSDVTVQWEISRSLTDIAVGTAVTEAPLDGDAPAAALIAISDVMTEPTYTQVLFDIGLNLRASWRWVAAPEGEIMVPAATSAVGLVPTGTAAVAAQGYMHWLE